MGLVGWKSTWMVVILPPPDFRWPWAIALLRSTHEATMANQPVYKVIFHNNNQVFEVFARQIYQSDMWGFIEVEEFVFGERSQILVDPSEEKLKSEFNGVKRSYIPLQAIIRIDEVDKEGTGKISDASSGDSNVSSFPFAGMKPGQHGADE
jgi:hypothetical protein